MHIYSLSHTQIDGLKKPVASELTTSDGLMHPVSSLRQVYDVIRTNRLVAVVTFYLPHISDMSPSRIISYLDGSLNPKLHPYMEQVSCQFQSPCSAVVLVCLWFLTVILLLPRFDICVNTHCQRGYCMLTF